MTDQLQDQQYVKMRKVLEGLLAMTEANGATVAEAAVAAMKAQQIAGKYGIDMEKLRQEGKAPTEFIKFVYIKEFGPRRARLLSRICKFNRSRAVFNTVGRTIVSATLVGTQKAIELSLYLYEAINNNLYEMGKRLYTGKKAGYDSWFVDFYSGAMDVIIDRLQEGAELAKADPACTAIVVRGDADLEAAFLEFFPRLGTIRRNTAVKNPQAYAEGTRFGKSLQIHNPIEA